MKGGKHFHVRFKGGDISFRPKNRHVVGALNDLMRHLAEAAYKGIRAIDHRSEIGGKIKKQLPFLPRDGKLATAGPEP